MTMGFHRIVAHTTKIRLSSKDGGLNFWLSSKTSTILQRRCTKISFLLNSNIFGFLVVLRVHLLRAHFFGFTSYKTVMQEVFLRKTHQQVNRAQNTTDLLFQVIWHDIEKDLQNPPLISVCFD